MPNIIKALEILRWLLAGFGFYVAYNVLGHHEQALKCLVIFVVIPIMGLTGIESLFFGKLSAASKGWTSESPYQVQSGFNNLAISMTAIVALIFGWGQEAYMTLLTVMLLFLAMSAINHTKTIIIDKNFKMIHFLRPVLTFALIVAALPIMR